MVAKNNPKYCDGRYCKDEVLVYDLEARLKKLQKILLLFCTQWKVMDQLIIKDIHKSLKNLCQHCDTTCIQTCTKEEIINIYDNTILYTDFITLSTIDIVKKFDNFELGVFYVSDHCESL